MGLFSRKHPVDGTTNGHGHGHSPAPRASHEKHRDHQNVKFDIDSGYYNRRPSFGQWIKMTWLDIITMIIMGAIGLGVYRAPPAPYRSFPVYFQDGELVYPEFAYPLRKEIVPIWLAALLASLIPIIVILFMQIRIRSFWDINNAIIGLLYSLITAAVFQVFLKWLIGGLRPHFLAVCRPNIQPGQVTGNGYREIMYDRKICTGDDKQINDALESFPSGHSTAAWAGFLFLYFYLNAKLKIFSNHHPAMWKIIALYAPVLGATLISGALTIDEFHNWYDVVAGAIIGSVMAISAYRMVYASVWDFRFNHIPLTRHTPFAYGGGAPGAGGFESAVFTHKAGWGYEEALGGAPFDAAHGLRGAFGGAGGLRSGDNGVGHHNHGHGNHGVGGILGAGRHSHGDRDFVDTNHTTQHSHGSGGGIFSRKTHNHGNSNTTPIHDNTTSHPHNMADNTRYSNDITREPGLSHGHSGPGVFHHGADHTRNEKYEPTGYGGHHQHQGSGSWSIGRRPVPPAKEGYANDDRVV